MKKLLPVIAFALISLTSGCPKSGDTPAPAPPVYQPIIDGAIACLNAEKAALAKDVSVMQVALDVASALYKAATTKDFSGAVNDLIAKYKPIAGDAAESIVACAVQKAFGGEVPVPAGSGSDTGSGSAAAGSGSGMMATVKAPMAADKKAMLDAVIAEHNWKFKN